MPKKERPEVHVELVIAIPSITDPNCPYCRKSARKLRAKTDALSVEEIKSIMRAGELRGMDWHCESCWNRFHNGLRNKDWLPS
jgi:hypothetical protein